MTVPGNLSSPLLAVAAAGGAATANITKSVRFNSADAAHLNRTPSSAGSNTTWTLSTWVKKHGNDCHVFSAGAGNNPGRFAFAFDGSDKINVFVVDSGSTVYSQNSDAVFRDPAAWYHIVVVADTTNATAADRLIVYVNGVRISFSGGSMPSNQNTYVNTTAAHVIGRRSYNTNDPFDGYLADFYLIDGAALAPTSFGAFDDSGVWQAAAYSGTFGTNGFHLFDFASESTVGHDSSGNENDFTANNISQASITTWSNGWSNNLLSGFPATNSFNGTGTGLTIGGSNVKSTWTAPSSIPFTTLSIRGSHDGANIKVNGTDVTSQFSSGLSTVTVTGISSPLTSIDLDNTNGQGNARLSAIRIDGELLADATPYPGAGNDVLFDVPVNGDASDDTGAGGELSSNYCVLNSLTTTGGNTGTSSGTLSQGNMRLTNPGSNTWSVETGTIAVQSGKWYYEFVLSGTISNFLGGWADPQEINYNDAVGNTTRSYGYYSTGNVRNGNSNTSFGSSYTAGDVIGCAIDIDNQKIYWSKNGTWQNSANPAAGTGSIYTIQDPVANSFFYTIAVSTYDASSSVDINTGQRPFAYTAPSGFKTLCAANLPTPTIADGGAHFDAAIYTGTGSNISVPLGFEPDFIWTKSRSTTTVHVLQNSVSGITTKYLQLPGTDQEYDGTGGVQSTSATGFVQGTGSGVNTSGTTYVSWAWDAGANSSKTYAVKVVSDSGNKYRFDDFGTSAVTLDLEEGSTYVFDQSDSSNSGHPLRFSTTSDGTHGGGSEYTTGVTTTGTPGSAGAKTTIVVAASAPTLYYYCTNHSGMGGQANTNSTAGSSNFDGNIQSTVKASQTAGMSIVTWTGTGSAGTVGHGLGAKPGFIFTHRRSGSGQWPVYHSAYGATKYQYLNSTIEARTYQHFWNNTEPTSSVFSIGSDADVSTNSGTHIAFCFAPVAGFSGVGSYSGNGSADGSFVHLGFRPRWLLIKTSSHADNWRLWDSARKTYNATNTLLFPDNSIAEITNTAYDIDFLSNGFKLRTNNSDFNGSGKTMIYIAFAENPFQANGGLAR